MKMNLYCENEILKKQRADQILEKINIMKKQ